MNTTLIQLNTLIIFYLREPFFYTKEEIKDFFITKIKQKLLQIRYFTSKIQWTLKELIPLIPPALRRSALASKPPSEEGGLRQAGGKQSERGGLEGAPP